MDDQASPPDPVGAAKSGVRDLPSERAVAKIARRGVWTSGAGLVFVAVVVGAMAFEPGRGPTVITVIAAVALILAVILLGLGWTFSLIAAWQQRRLGVRVARRAVFFGLAAPMIAILLSTAGGAFILHVMLPIRERAAAADVWEMAQGYDWEQDREGLANLVAPAVSMGERGAAVDQVGLTPRRFDGDPLAWIVSDVELRSGNRSAILTLSRRDGAKGIRTLRLARDTFGQWSFVRLQDGEE